jgi:hypothetical protein
VAGSCDHSNEPFGSMKAGTFLTSLATVSFGTSVAKKTCRIHCKDNEYKCNVKRQLLMLV